MSGDEIYFYVSMGIIYLMFVLCAGSAVLLTAKIFRLIKRRKQKKSSISGLVIGLILVMLLMAAIFPNFFKYGGAPQPQSSARTNLKALFIAQQIYFADHGAYAGGPNAFQLLGWVPVGRSRYSFFCGDDFIPNRRGDPIPRSVLPPDTGSSATGFTCSAVGNIDNDPDLDYWQINDAKQIENVPSSDLY